MARPPQAQPRGKRMPQRVKDKVQAARNSGRLKNFKAITRKKNYIEQITCRTCDAIIRKLVPDDRFREVKVIGGQRTVFERLIPVNTEQYCEIEMEMDDGSSHVATTCKSCARSLSPDALKDMYASDLDDFNDEEEAGFGEVPWNFIGDKVPTGVYTIVKDENDGR